MKRLIVALSLVGYIAVGPVGVAHADCDTPGDFGAGAGCAPPGSDSSSGGGTESWPPTSVDWPPQFESALGGGDKEKPAPIVMPDGMTSPATAGSPSSSPAAAPIVGAGSASGTSTSTTATPIVMPGS